MTDFRALCAELVHLNEVEVDDWKRKWVDAVRRTKAALAQPEPQGPTDEELEAFAEPFMEVTDDSFTGVIYDEVAYARAVLARWGTPTIQEDYNR